MQLNIRQTTSSDSQVLLEILEDTRKFKLSLGDKAWGEYPFTENDVELRLKSGNCYLAELDNHIIGSITLLWNDKYNWGKDGEDSTAGYIHGLMIRAEYRGHNHGKQMIIWAIDQVRNKKRSYVRLDCHSDNKKLCKYYENLNFKLFKTNNGIAFYQLVI